jgi:two-component system LytT family response regulator
VSRCGGAGHPSRRTNAPHRPRNGPAPSPPALPAGRRYILDVTSRVLIADDEPLARERLRALVAAHAPAAEIREVGHGDAAIESIRTWAPQLVFLDIQMPGTDGFGVVSAIGPDRMPPTAFVTAYDEHALRAFEVAAVDYLLKPFDDDRFALTWQRLTRAHAASSMGDDARRFAELIAAVQGQGAAAPRHAERFLVRVGDRTLIVPAQEVRWAKSDGNYVDLFTASGTHTIRETITALEAQLDPARFVRVHRRIIVAIDFIRELQPWFAGDQVLILRDGTKLRVSRTRREALAARLAGRA